jgi:SAM-dependent methyltransferase
MTHPPRARNAVAAVWLVLCAAFGVLWTPACSSRNSERAVDPAQAAEPADQTAAVKETTVRNVTGAPVNYAIQPLRSGATAMEHTLDPDKVDRFPGDTLYNLSFHNGVQVKLYLIRRGTAHSFRIDENGRLELYTGAHGREDVPDLAPFLPTPMAVVEKMLELAEIQASDVIYDLGCGDGRIVIAAAKRFGARGVGIDVVPERVFESRAGAERAGVAALLEFKLQNVFDVDISPATVVVLYLLPESNLLLRPKLEAELAPGTRVVSHNYSIEGWESKGARSENVTDEKGVEHTVYIYRR